MSETPDDTHQDTTMYDTTTDTTEVPDDEIVDRKSEIVYIFDAKDANPNGDPTSPSNKPRIVPNTGEAAVTDVRLKRYLRDQLDEDGHGIYVVEIREDGVVAERGDLLLDCLSDEFEQRLRDGEPVEDILDDFLESAADIRLFGATMSIKRDTDDGEAETTEEVIQKAAGHLPGEFEGPVQLTPARSMNSPVQLNKNYDSLTSVIASSEDSGQGGFDLDDHRVQYAIFPVYGVVNPAAAEDTHLTKADVRRLDSLFWRAMKNQTLTRSKVGQQPRLYVRVEYADGYGEVHTEDLHLMFELSEEHSLPPEELKDIRDVAVDATEFVNFVEDNEHKIGTIHLKSSRMTDFVYEDEVITPDQFVGILRDCLGEDGVEEIDVREVHKATKLE